MFTFKGSRFRIASDFSIAKNGSKKTMKYSIKMLKENDLQQESYNQKNYPPGVKQNKNILRYKTSQKLHLNISFLRKILEDVLHSSKQETKLRKSKRYGNQETRDPT